MKKIFIFSSLLVLILLGACSSKDDANKDKDNSINTDDAGTITYESENGPVEVPANPQRVVVLSTYAGDVIHLGVPIVGADSWSMDNPNFADALKDAEEVSDESLEKIIELEPDLIIGLSSIKNVDKLKEIAPTVTFTYGKVDYLQQHIEIGKLLNKEKEATEWVESFKAEAKELGEKIKDKIGPNATVSVIEDFDKQLYVFGDNWGRGTEILYQAMGLNMPESVKEIALKDGYYALSLEVLPKYAGDYMIFSRSSGADSSYLESDTYKNIPAVKNGHVFEVDQRSFYFNDATTLEYQLEFFEENFLQD
ncbi:iron-hydroxamate ABC transporter substrate-binding protein [Ornithinibacillus gellani]|uniref:iron-hydroxamate ABC transporter substrate-binding protein n=1 Tax=Ornithinibacillus gellani TaxID=2293253 RepID=UPI000F4976D3|nr:iron-hydroxamate ABC transporter substrate-binding protein [Ornithinibacillus gellani]TQS75890.1 iron-hydroxamate ABC transporter substrate-binding protein [Ornithinibacillus gellani]